MGSGAQAAEKWSWGGLIRSKEQEGRRTIWAQMPVGDCGPSGGVRESSFLITPISQGKKR